MAIYEPKGERINLTGYQQGGEFRPGRVYDPSQQILQSGQQDVGKYKEILNLQERQYARNLETDIQALTQFSGTLNEFVQSTVKRKNEEQYALGLADVINGTAELKPEFLEKHRRDSLILKESAEADSAVASTLENQGQIAVAEEFRNKSQAISGWRAYGQAVGTAKKAASKSQAFFSSFMEGTQPVVPLPDGRFIAPNQAANPAEIEAALEVAQQQFLADYGVKQINPAIIVEHLAPTLQAVRGQLATNQLMGKAKEARENAISDLDGQTISEFSNPSMTSGDMSESFQRLTSDYQIKGGLSRGAASDRALERALAGIKSLPKDVAESLLANLAQVPKIANDPNSITLGSAYADQFAAAADGINDRAVALEQRADAEREKLATRAIDTLTKARQDVNMPAQELKLLKRQTVQTLGLLADQGSSRALQLRGELLAEPENVDYTLYRQYRQGIAQGMRPSKAQLDKDFQAGLLTANMVDELDDYSTGSDRNDFMKQFGKTIADGVKAHLREAGAISLNPFGTPLKHTFHVEQVTNDLADIAYKAYDSARRQGKPLEDNDINQLLTNQLPRVVGRYFQQNPTTKDWTTRPISRNPAVTPDKVKSTLRGYVPDAGGFDPRTIQLRRLTSGGSRQLSKAETEDNINRFLNGQPPTPRAATLATSNPGGLIQLLNNQAQINDLDPTPITNSPQAKRFAEFQSVAPRATERLVSSNNYLDQMLQLRRIAEAQQRAARIREIGKGPGPAVDLKPGARVGTREMLQLALQNGLDPERAILMTAVGMAESSGDSGVRNQNAQTGDDSYGLWQINMIGNLGPDRLRRYGLRSAEDLKDPETNARVMAQMLSTDGTSAWGAFRDKRYLQYMPEARRIYAQLKREGFNQARGGRANFSPTNVQSVRIETPGNSFQPGLDLWFADKQFGAVLPGRVKEIRRNYGNYGNMIVVESTDAQTGEPVDVVYAHLDAINVREGDQVSIGSVLGKQGGTGRVVSQDGTIASIDFLAPAPKGSTSMTPYRRWKPLANRIKQSIQSGRL